MMCSECRSLRPPERVVAQGEALMRVEASRFDGEHVIGSIPIVSPSSVTDYTDLVHLNVEHNPSSFAVVPVGQAEPCK